MKSFLLYCLIVLPLCSFAQDRRPLDRVRAAREAFITEELELSDREADKFFPVYYALEQRRRELMRDRFFEPRLDLSDEEAAALMAERHARRLAALEFKREAELAYLEVLPASKVIRLEQVELAFRRKLMSLRGGRRPPGKN